MSYSVVIINVVQIKVPTKQIQIANKKEKRNFLCLTIKYYRMVIASILYIYVPKYSTANSHDDIGIRKTWRECNDNYTSERQ
jgi:hypothetical protein